MQEIKYKTFSLKIHKKNWHRMKPNVCQFELTFQCGLNCNHCYTSCYNNQESVNYELGTEEIKFILDKVYASGAIWLCLTGGDPLERADFLDIYSYAKKKGFIVTLFTNGYSMTKEIAGYLKKAPPFVIELTLNSITKDTYEKISQVKSSFEKTMSGLRMLVEKKLPLKIKTQVTKNNLIELPGIKKFVENLGLTFRPSSFLHARLDGDMTPCSLRIELKDALRLVGKAESDIIEKSCISEHAQIKESNNEYLFNCAIGGGDGLYIDPCGYLVPCDCIRDPRVNLLRKDIKEAQKTILEWVRSSKFIRHSRCKTCGIRNACYSCPGKALLETGNLEKPVQWFCQLANSAVK